MSSTLFPKFVRRCVTGISRTSETKGTRKHISSDTAFDLKFLKADSTQTMQDLQIGGIALYGKANAPCERRAVLTGLSALLAAALAGSPVFAQAKPLKMAVLGDSLTAGLGLPMAAAFPARLQVALAGRGLMTDIINAGVSGDTSSGGLDRLDWSIPDGTQAVIVELGANDALRGLDPAVTRAALDKILARLKARGMAAFLCGMYAPRNYGPDYIAKFDSIYPDLAKKYGVPLYPFFLDGVAGDAKLNQQDGMHPTAEGVEIVVRRILPAVEAWLRPMMAQAG